MAEHHELVAEMPVLEQMGTQERQKLAKKRRLQQLKKWGQREKEWIAKEKQLNKRLANTLHEENNGLNLKQYTTYSSNHRSKKKLQLISAARANGAAKNNNNNNNDFLLNNNTELNDRHHTGGRFRSTNGSDVGAAAAVAAGLTPHGKVRFNVGVMLLEAAARNDFDEVKRLLMLGVSPDSVNHDGLTALHQCCIDASEPMMNLLLEFGANVDARDTEQWTPLHAACTCGHLNLAKILVENGANLLAVNGDGNMPFDICEDEATLDYIESQMVKRGITQEMIDFTRASTEMRMISDLEKHVAAGKDVNVANENGVTPLHIAAANGYLSVVKFLIKHGVDVNVCDNDQWRPLHGAACWGTEQHTKVIELLVEAGAELDAKTINDETAFDLCDNAQLLERLNRLKDELESKQASGADRLRRTQSRTNSRVHSVRRTSVRDKNQISRRDAREEALLRVENSPAQATNGTAKMQNGGPQSRGNSLEQQDKEIVNGNSNEVSPDVSVEKASENLASSQPVATNDQVDGLASNNEVASMAPSVNGENRALFTQTDLDDAFTTNLDKLDHQQQSQENPTARSQNQPTHAPQDDPAKKTRKPLAQQAQAEHSGSPPDIPADSQKERQRIVASTSVDKIPAKPPQAMRSSSSVISTTEPSTLTAANDETTNDDRETNNVHINHQDTACDQTNSLQKQKVASTVSVVQIAPINYTLSNLKKQRSDLRMRTTSIGGGSITGTTTITQHHQQVVVLDPQPASLPVGSGINGLQRPESPSLTFRKFSGEPSEAICGREKNSRHKCCILI